MEARYIFRKTQLLDEFKLPLRFSSRSCHACTPLWSPLSPSSMVR